MDRESIRFNSFMVNSKGKENHLLEETDRIDKSQAENCTQDDQTCICDPAFTSNDSSTSSTASEESCNLNECMDNDWIKCENNILRSETSGNLKKPGDKSRKTNFKFLPTEVGSKKVPTVNHKLSRNESSHCFSPIDPSLVYHNDDKNDGLLPTYESDPLNKTNSLHSASNKNTIHFDNSPYINKVQIYKGGIEPYFVQKLLKGSQKNIFSKLYIGGYENYHNELTNSSDNVTESDSSLYSEGSSSKRIIKSILKREGTIPMGDNQKKKVTFNLNRDGYISEITKTNPLSNKTQECKTSSTSPRNSSENINKSQSSKTITHKLILEKEIKLPSGKFNKSTSPVSSLNSFGDKVNVVNSKPNYEKNKKSVAVFTEQENKSPNHNKICLPQSQLKENTGTNPNMNSGDSNTKATETTKRSVSEIPTEKNSVGVQSDFLKQDFNGQAFEDISKHSDLKRTDEKKVLKSEELKKAGTGDQFTITNNEYSFFIKDLVTGSGDRLAKFLSSLSTEISSKEGQEKLTSALVNVGFAQEDNKNKQIMNPTPEKISTNDELRVGAMKKKTKTISKNKCKYVDRSLSNYNYNTNERYNKKNKKRGYLVKAKRSMSEININHHSKIPHYNGYMEKRLHTSSVNKLFINKKSSDSVWNGLSVNSNNEKNDCTIGKLHDLMAELKGSIEKLNAKESTIHIENAQIWLKENNSIEQNSYENEIRKVLNLSKKRVLHPKRNGTKETFSQPNIRNGRRYFLRENKKEATDAKREILIISNSKNEEINIKLNEKNIQMKNLVLPQENATSYIPAKKVSNITHRKDFVLSDEPKQTPTGYLENILANNEETAIESERGRQFFEENVNGPFSIVFNDKTQLPMLKKGKYLVHVFEKIDEPVIQETSVKNLLKKISEQMSMLKLNGLHSQRYEKPPNLHQIQENQIKSPNIVEDKPAGNIFQGLLNRLLKFKVNGNLKDHMAGNSKRSIDQKNQASFLKSIFPFYSHENNYCQGSYDYRMQPKNIDIFKSEQFTSGSINHGSSNCINMSDEEQWPDIVKTKYPNGMIHYGPLTLMPEPDTRFNVERQCMNVNSCSCPHFGKHYQYSYNKHMVETSMSKSLNNQPKTKISSEFRETEQEFYHHWSHVGKV